MKRKIIQAGLSAIVTTMLFVAPAAAAIRPAIGQPLQQAMHLYLAKDYKGALAWIDKADAVPNKTAEEQKVIYQLREAIRVASSDPRIEHGVPRP